MKRLEDEIVEKSYERVNNEKELLKEDIIYFENDKNVLLKIARYTKQSKEQINEKYDNIMIGIIASRYSYIYNYDAEILYDIAQEGYKKGKCAYNKKIREKEITRDLTVLVDCIFEATNAALAKRYSDYVNYQQTDKINVRDIEIVERYKDACDYLRKNPEKELLNRDNQKYLVRVLSKSDEEVEDNYKLLDRLGMFENSKAKIYKRKKKK